MPKNVMKLLKPSPHRQRNDFDLSHRHVLDANFGELLPATCIETVPGDNITLHASDLLRNIPFVSSPFLRAKQHLDVWFVPYHDLWHQFDAFITKKSEPVSSAFKGTAYCPWFDQNGMFNAINSAIESDIVGRPLAERSYYLLQLLGYGDIKDHHGGGTASGTYKVNPFRLAAYNYIWYNEYRQQYYDDGSRILNTSTTSVANLFNFDACACNSLESAVVYSSLVNSDDKRRLLRAMSQMRYRCWKKDLFTGLLPATQFGNVSTLSGGSVTGLTAAFTGTAATINSTNAASVDVNGTTGVLNEFYGNVESETYSVGDHPSLDLSVTGVNELSTYDVITGKPIVQGQRSSSYMHGSVEVGGTSINANGVNVSASYTPAGSVSLNSDTGTLSFDVLALRKAEAVQIWRENALRAGNHIKDNMMAHYGVASDFNDHRPTYLGSVSAPLNISDIATTANSSSGINDTVGDIAGKGLSSLSEKVFKFHAKDFGVIMVMLSILPEAEYDATGIDRMNQLLEAEDFFIPEYENLGLEAVGAINIASGYEGKPVENTVIGYAPRYYGYKQKMDKVFGEFIGTGLFRSWSSQRTDVSDWYSRTVMPSTPLQFMYVNPALYDANFNVGISVCPQFLCDMYFDVDAVRPMSVIGLPFS